MQVSDDLNQTKLKIQNTGNLIVKQTTLTSEQVLQTKTRCHSMTGYELPNRNQAQRLVSYDKNTVRVNSCKYELCKENQELNNLGDNLNQVKPDNTTNSKII